MAFAMPKITYTGKIKEVTLGKGPRAAHVGGETSYPFCLFEGKMPYPPKIAMEIWDMEPDDWPEAVIEPFKDVLKDPAAWAKKCVEECGADMIVVQLKSTDPNGPNKGPNEASSTVKKVCESVNVPVAVWGCGNKDKDVEVLKKIAEDNGGMNLLLGPVEEASHKQIAASAMGFNQSVIASTSIDINLAKQLNILLDNLGLSPERVVIDPTTGGLGYGLEYSYSVMERIRMAALTQEDEKLQSPIINLIGNEIWKCKEAKQSLEEAPTLGDPSKRGVMMECVAAITYLMAGSDILVLRHPESVKLVKEFIDLMITGDLAISPDKLAAKLCAINVKPEGDYPRIKKVEIKAEPKEEKKEAPKAPPKVEAKPKVKEEEKKEAPKAPPKVEAKPKVKEEEKIAKKPEVTQEGKAEVEAKAKIEAEGKAKEEAEKKAKAEAEAKAKAEEEAKAKAEAEVKAMAEAEKKAKEETKEKVRAEEEALKQARAKEKAEREKPQEARAEGPRVLKIAEVQLSPVDKLLAQVNRVNKRSVTTQGPGARI